MKDKLSYNGSVTFSAGVNEKNTKHNLSGNYTVNGIKYDLPKVSNNKAQFESWLPFYLGGDLSKEDRSSYDTSYPCCNNNWWLVQTGDKNDFVWEEE